LWDFPRFPLDSARPADVRRELAENVLALTGAVIAPERLVKTLTHGVTRFRITLECYEAEFLSNGKRTATTLETRWLRPKELEKCPLSSTGRKLAGLLQTVGQMEGDGGGCRKNSSEHGKRFPDNLLRPPRSSTGR
jgi:A/G-specific adenine glycosylase